MRNIAELNMLLRVRAELPEGLELATDDFREGWRFVRKIDAHRLEKKVRTRGWHLVRSTDESLRSGVGQTSQEAVAGALKLALRRVGEYFNAVEVEHIEITSYPWFFLARVRVFPFRIQQAAVPPLAYEVARQPFPVRHSRLASRPSELFTRFGSAMPMLKEMLAASRDSQEKRL
jgi:hypothetical protein